MFVENALRGAPELVRAVKRAERQGGLPYIRMHRVLVQCRRKPQASKPFDDPQNPLYKGNSMSTTVVIARGYFTFPWSTQG
jgi:hypothetical protein